MKNDIGTYRPDDERLNGIYRGVIEDNKDPEKMGRCKIRVYGIHTHSTSKDELDGIPTDELPWSEPALGLFEGSVSGYGGWTIPLQGSHVFLFFENGHMLQPRYFASAPGLPTETGHGYDDGFSDPDGEYPDKLNEPDWDSNARGEETREREGTIQYDPEYPHNTVFRTHGDLIIELDSTPNNERINIWHKKAGSYIEMDINGNMIIHNTNDRYEIVDGDTNVEINKDRNLTISGDYNITVNGDANINANGNINASAGGDVDINANGNINASAGGDANIGAGGTCNVSASGTVNIDASGPVNINGAMVNINS